ncbi:MAG TPA: hypothetical protein VG826_34155 [Pirellulales bacterium]|nr:hypothetical protein [Pirellulales bacterium]
MAFYVEGTELLFQYDYEPNRIGNDRLKQLRFDSKIDGDLPTLTSGDVSQTWKRIKDATIER